MEFFTRKRKGSKSSTAVSSLVRSRKKNRRVKDDGSAAILMTAPPSTSSSPLSPNRGHKRKIGCLDPNRKKKFFSEYKIRGLIGKGKFGSVKICEKVQTKEEFAVKILKKNGEECVNLEVEIMRHLSGHKNVVTLKAFFEDDENCYLVMELCKGGRLLDLMKEVGMFSEQKAAKIVKELVGVLKYCHEMGVVHRDVKPENVLVESGGIKLADFGLAVRLTKGQKLSGIAGSPAYVAPEVITGHYSEKVDIWSAGILLHALLVGYIPFKGNSLEAVFEAIKTTELDFTMGSWGSVSDLARDLVMRMLTRDPSSRITTEEILRHPWILLYTESQPKALAAKSKPQKTAVLRLNFAALSVSYECSSPTFTCSNSSSNSDEDEDDDDGFVDALAQAISRVKISEPKRSRVCLSPANPIQQECSSNMKSNLCAAF